MMKYNPKIAFDKLEDHNKVEYILYINFTLKTIKLIIIIFNFSYFFAMVWVMCCKGVEDFVNNVDY